MQPAADRESRGSHQTLAPIAAQLEHVVSFNRIIKRLTVDLHARHPEDATIWRAKERIMLAIDQWPFYIIDEVGRYLYAYRKQILAGDAVFFMETGFDAELEAGIDRGQVELTAYIIPCVKASAMTLTLEERREYFQMVQDLLDDYIEYLAAKRLDGEA